MSVFHVTGNAKLLWRDQHELNACIARQRRDQRVNRSAVFEVSAKADGQMIQASLFTVDRKQICQGLRRMCVSAVARVDHGNARALRCHIGCTLLGMAHRDNIGITADDLRGIRHTLTLRCRAARCLGKSEHVTAKLHHRGLKAQSRTGRWLKEERGELLALASLRIFFRIGNNIICSRDQGVDLLDREIENIN